MKKEFIEYEGNTVPYRASEICFCLSDYARRYILENRDVIKNIDTNVRDAVLVDLINYLGTIGCIDFGIYTKDLYEDKEVKVNVDDRCLLSGIYKNLSYYLFYGNAIESIKLNNHMNSCKEKINFNDLAFVVADFINYIFEVNDYERKLTLFEMKTFADEIAHNIEMNKLKEFLISTNEFNDLLVKGEDVVKLYRNISSQNKLDYIDKNDVYHYVSDVAKKLGRSEMFSCDIVPVREKLYAMMYAYGKICPTEIPQNEALGRILKSMRTIE